MVNSFNDSNHHTNQYSTNVLIEVRTNVLYS